MHTILKSATKEITIGIDKSFVMIGEKINPTGSKKLAAALREGNYDFVAKLAQRQVTWGAEVLDVNVGLPDFDEVTAMAKVVETVSAAVDVPLCIDSAGPAVLESGLKAAQGKPLVNSASGEEERLAKVLPLAKEYNAAVIGLTIGDEGIPPTAEARFKVADTIISHATKIGIPIEDIIIDPLVMTVGSDSKAAQVTLKTIELVRKEFGVNISLGASNISFGLPDRFTVNQIFLAMAIQAGATCSITDPVKLGRAIRASDLLMGRDNFAMKFIKYFRSTEALREQENQPAR